MEKKIHESWNEQDTYRFGEQLAQSAAAGSLYCLEGDLGVGKTVFTQGFAHGLGIEEPVTSPTFTIVQEYETGRIPLYHFDVYRLADPEELEEIGYEEYFFGEGVLDRMAEPDRGADSGGCREDHDREGTFQRI